MPIFDLWSIKYLQDFRSSFAPVKSRTTRMLKKIFIVMFMEQIRNIAECAWKKEEITNVRLNS